MVDGAAWLDHLKSNPDAPVLLSHDQAVAIASSLAASQKVLAGQQRLGVAMLSIGGDRS